MICKNCSLTFPDETTTCPGCGNPLGASNTQVNGEFKGILLSEPVSPLPDTLRKLNYIYWIGIGIGLILGCCTGFVTIPATLLICFIFAYATKGIIAGFKLIGMSKIKYHLPKQTTPAELAELLEEPLSKEGMKIQNLRFAFLIWYKSLPLSLIIDNSDMTFRFKRGGKLNLLTRHDIRYYKLAIVAIPIIAKIIQDNLQ